MASCEASAEPGGTTAGVANTCPRWCFTDHGVHLGEEDWIHTSQPVRLADDRVARMCMSIDPDTGIEDGPYVLIGDTELTVDQAKAVGESLLRLVRVDRP